MIQAALYEIKSEILLTQPVINEKTGELSTCSVGDIGDENIQYQEVESEITSPPQMSNEQAVGELKGITVGSRNWLPGMKQQLS